MKITVFTENSHRGGLDTFLATLISNWPRPDDEITLICNADHPGLDDIEARLRRKCRIVRHDLSMQWRWMNRFERVPVIGRLRKPVSPLLRYLFFAYYLRALRKILLADGADRLVIANGGYPGGDTCRAATIVWGRHSGRPGAIHCFHSMAIQPRPWERWIENRIDAGVLRSSSALVTVSRACVKSLGNRPAIDQPGKLRHIYNGIEPPASDRGTIAADIRREFSIAPENPVCLMLGSYQIHKGHEFLFRTFRQVLSRMPDAHLVVCGYGYEEEFDRVRKLAMSAGSENIHLSGFRTDTASVIDAADVVLVTSQSFEAFGLTIIEAWAQHTPVVATAMGGIPEVMGDEEEGGYCVAHDDAASFADRVIRLLADPALRRQKAEGGYRRYQAHFTARRMAAEYAEMLAPANAEPGCGA